MFDVDEDDVFIEKGPFPLQFRPKLGENQLIWNTAGVQEQHTKSTPTIHQFSSSNRFKFDTDDTN